MIRRHGVPHDDIATLIACDTLTSMANTVSYLLRMCLIPERVRPCYEDSPLLCGVRPARSSAWGAQPLPQAEDGSAPPPGSADERGLGATDDRVIILLQNNHEQRRCARGGNDRTWA